MIKHTIVYTDFDGKEQTEDAYFNLSKIELMEMDIESNGSLGDKIKEIVSQENIKEIYAFFKTLIVKAYGKKSSDGRRFIKSPEMVAEFLETNAYEALIFELISNEEKAATFVNAMIAIETDAH